MGMKNNQAAGTEFLYSENFKYDWNEIKRMTKILTKV